MNRENYFIRTFTKVFKEETGKYWWINVFRLIEETSKYNYDEMKILRKIELTEEDENKKIAHPKTIKRAIQFCQGYVVGKEKKDPSVTIETIKAMGKALCHDENAFLIEIEKHNIIQVLQQSEEIYGNNDISYIYRLMNTLLYALEPTSYYSFAMGTQEDGFDYYDARIQEIRREVDNRFWNHSEIRDKLYKLLEDEETFIKSYSRPGVPERWMVYNPHLRYFDCVYDFIEKAPELYEQIKNSKILHFSFYPDETECRARKEYFDALREKNERLQYSIDRCYQNEVVEAFRLVFNSEFQNLNL